ncbi:MAG: Holliday junction resolvase RuvX [gamma proteobacterium symbiont of Bathyaustriella thionipta]|nr:Holliday junction resolvase RuvX [gamma proteobacterium symbiont of Bathyaustriella thionipta]MCU7949899.1 Holliday junction resolvase RuvX [gamma proteobacterium symbiont of Bathyaustriella thionipta]MCU7954067.1 Holliday junction resolvase RuvX [gamma proteobacterium symbiont of Bathyaustriella thionipta]MCU7956496.1 Holliday junction resolvase RuvX [gamma proteobacterium symbiont of Bathyaustriella thionipta]MCU7968562.1 Holliday junction resolvase RuvX [gamma proteobacterium symbiont of 
MPDYPLTSTFLGFDYSQNKIGIAVGQRLTGTASSLTTLISRNKKIDWPGIEQLLEQWRPVAFVIGLPLTMEGEEQETTEAVKLFGNQLNERYNLPIHFMDERLTSREASHLLGYDGHTSPRRHSKPGKKVKKNKQQGHDIDQLAAQLILQSWLNETG